MTPWLDDDDGPCIGVCAGCDESCSLLAAPTAIDWARWRKCTVCHAEISEPCRSLSGTVTGGRPDGVVTVLAVPHSSRQRRSRAVA